MDEATYSNIINPGFFCDVKPLIQKFTTTLNIGKGPLNAYLQTENRDLLTPEMLRDMSCRAFLQDVNMCRRTMECGQCRRQMLIVWRGDGKSKHFAFRCGRAQCQGKRKSMYSGTFLEGTKLQSWIIIGLFRRMLHSSTYTQSAIQRDFKLSKNTVSQWCVWVREALATLNAYQQIDLGGPENTVYVDEMFGGRKRKYARGNPNRGMRKVDPKTKKRTKKKVQLLVICELTSNKLVVREIPTNSRVVIEPLFVKHVKGGSMVHTDAAAVYQSIPQWGPGKKYRHKAVNHSVGQFARKDSQDETKTVSSNKVEGVISHLRKHYRKHHGFPYGRFMLAIEEFIYHRNSPQVSLDAFMRDVASVYLPERRLLDSAPNDGLYKQYMNEWRVYCQEPEIHREQKECDCELPTDDEDDGGEEDLDDEAGEEAELDAGAENDPTDSDYEL